MAGLSLPGLGDLRRAQQRGEGRALVAVCSANRFVLEAALAQAAADRLPLLVESTSNQVAPEGGYTGLRAAGFAALVRVAARAAGLAPELLALGGDHLGPYPYRAQPAARAMAAGCEQVRQCAAAGYAKLHLDASMRLGGDAADGPSPELVAERTAELCACAEQALDGCAADASPPVYVVGSDVPAPGGETSEESPPAVTTAEEAERALGLARAAFASRGLGAAWQRVVALVVQPGVGFGAARVHDYDPAAAAPLAAFARRREGLVLEAHSTDYQRPAALAALAQDGFGVLKVGPWLTFAFRRAVLGLEAVEREWLAGRPGVTLSRLRELLEAAMDAAPRHWQGHHRPQQEGLRALRAFGYSDRVRYYWPAPAVQEALARLRANLDRHPVPLPLLAQHLPAQHDAVRAGRIDRAPDALVRHAVQQVLDLYPRAPAPAAAAAAGQCG